VPQKQRKGKKKGLHARLRGAEGGSHHCNCRQKEEKQKKDERAAAKGKTYGSGNGKTISRKEAVKSEDAELHAQYFCREGRGQVERKGGNRE